jgi:type II secretory pathway component PulK
MRFNGGSMNLDGSWYLVNGVRGAAVSVQDEAGLFNLNSSDEPALAALLELSGQPNGASLAATLMDYTDGDDLTRDRGAEARDYERAGMPAPADRPLFSRWQALEALGWRGSRVERGEGWTWLTARSAETGLNDNTAPAPVLEAVLGDRRRAETLIAQRQTSALTDIAQVEALTGGTARANGVTLAVAPATGFRVQAVFGSRGPRHGIERVLELGGAEAVRPFKWIEEREVRLAPLRDGEAINSLSLDAPAS